jgi:hypothetical protein
MNDDKVLQSSIENEKSLNYDKCLKLFQEDNYNDALLLLN